MRADDLMKRKHGYGEELIITLDKVNVVGCPVKFFPENTYKKRLPSKCFVDDQGQVMSRLFGGHRIENRKSMNRHHFKKYCKDQQGMKSPVLAPSVARLCDILFQFTILIRQKAISKGPKQQ